MKFNLMIQTIEKYLYSDNDPTMQRRITDILFDQVKVALLTNVLAGFLYTTIMLSVIPQATIFTWLSVLIVFAILRCTLVYRYLISTDEFKKSNWWFILFIISTIFMASIWGSTIFLLPENETIYETLTILFLCALSAGAVATLSISKLAVMTFMIPVLIPGTIALSLSDSYICNVLSITMAIYFGFLTLAALNTNRSLVRGQLLEIENIKLVEILAKDNIRIEKFNEVLEKQVNIRTSELHKTNRALKVLNECNQALQIATDEQELFNKICQIVVETGESRMVAIGIADDEDKLVHMVASYGQENDYFNDMQVNWRDDNEHGLGPVGIALRTGQVYFTRDMKTDSTFSPWRESALERGFRSNIVLPLLLDEQRIGILLIYSSVPNAVDDDEAQLLIRLADNLTYGILSLRAHHERKQMEEELKGNEEKTRLILENSLDGFITIDTQGLVNNWNRQSENIFGWTLEEVFGKKLSDLIIPKDQRKAHVKGMQHLIETGEGPILNKRIEVKAAHKDGHLIPIELAISPIDSGGEVLYSAFVRDISDRLNKESELIHAQKMEVMGRLTGGIAHDFNNLLTVIIGNLKFLKEEIEDDLSEEDNLLINSALTAAWDGAELTHGLLAVSRKQLLQPISIEVNPAIDEIIYMIKRTLGTNINITFSNYTNTVNVFADPALLKNALFNLTINARDAMPNGGDIRIDAKLKVLDSNSDNLEPGPYVVISVTDNGRGMTEEEIGKVFDPFFTTKESGRGTGLGLSTVYGFAKQSGGITKISSVYGKGTTVSIFLPATDTGIETSLDNSIEEELAHGTETILVTEDEVGVRMLAVKILKKYGYDVLEAENADAAIEIMNSGNKIDLLFSDIMMPGKMSGTELSFWVADNYPDIKIILTTGFDKKSFKNDRSIPPSIPVLHKPYSKSQLALQVRLSLDS
jgi:PAS domain S-box-containing protein